MLWTYQCSNQESQWISIAEALGRQGLGVMLTLLSPQSSEKGEGHKNLFNIWIIQVKIFISQDRLGHAVITNSPKVSIA